MVVVVVVLVVVAVVVVVVVVGGGGGGGGGGGVAPVAPVGMEPVANSRIWVEKSNVLQDVDSHLAFLPWIL